jgi:hypothetical protein
MMRGVHNDMLVRRFTDISQRCIIRLQKFSTFSLIVSATSLFVVILLDLMMSFSSTAVEKDIIRSSMNTTKRVSQAMSWL